MDEFFLLQEVMKYSRAADEYLHFGYYSHAWLTDSLHM